MVPRIRQEHERTQARKPPIPRTSLREGAQQTSGHRGHIAPESPYQKRPSAIDTLRAQRRKTDEAIATRVADAWGDTCPTMIREVCGDDNGGEFALSLGRGGFVCTFAVAGFVSIQKWCVFDINMWLVLSFGLLWFRAVNLLQRTELDG